METTDAKKRREERELADRTRLDEFTPDAARGEAAPSPANETPEACPDCERPLGLYYAECGNCLAHADDYSLLAAPVQPPAPTRTCPTCDGSGVQGRERCAECSGGGVAWAPAPDPDETCGGKSPTDAAGYSRGAVSSDPQKLAALAASVRPIVAAKDEVIDTATGRRFVPCASSRGVPIADDPCPGERHEYDMVYGTGICPGHPLNPAPVPPATTGGTDEAEGWIGSEREYLFAIRCDDRLVRELRMEAYLAARDARTRADALREAADEMDRIYDETGAQKGPHWLRDRADQIGGAS